MFFFVACIILWNYYFLYYDLLFLIVDSEYKVEYYIHNVDDYHLNEHFVYRRHLHQVNVILFHLLLEFELEFECIMKLKNDHQFSQLVAGKRLFTHIHTLTITYYLCLLKIILYEK